MQEFYHTFQTENVVINQILNPPYSQHSQHQSLDNKPENVMRQAQVLAYPLKISTFINKSHFALNLGLLINRAARSANQAILAILCRWNIFMQCIKLKLWRKSMT